jgi:hypothetical protein
MITNEQERYLAVLQNSGINFAIVGTQASELYLNYAKISRGLELLVNPEPTNRKKFEGTTTNFFISRGATALGLEKLAEQMKKGHMNFGRGQSATEVTYHITGVKTEKVFQQIQKGKILTKEAEMNLPIISLENHFANRRAIDLSNGGEYITEEIKKLNEVASMKNGEKKEMVLAKSLNYQGVIIPAETPVKGYKSFNDVQKIEAKAQNKAALDILFFEKSLLPKEIQNNWQAFNKSNTDTLSVRLGEDKKATELISTKAVFLERQNRIGLIDKEKIKSEVDFISFAQDYNGYQINAKKSTARYAFLENEDGTEKYVVYKHEKTGIPNYFNVFDKREGGDIIAFAMNTNRLNNFYEAALLLQQYNEGGLLVRKNTEIVKVENKPSSFDFKKITDEEILKLRKELRNGLHELTDYGYLESRGLLKETINSPELVDRYKNSHHYNKELKINYSNIAAPLFDRNGEINNVTNRNVGFRKNAKGQIGEGLFLTNVVGFGITKETFVEENGEKIPKGSLIKLNPNAPFDTSKITPFPKNVDRLVVFESDIDLTSFHQLYPPVQGESRLYISTAGLPSKEQMVHIQHLVDKYQPQQLWLANDKDPAGQRMNINLMGTLDFSAISNSQNSKMKVEASLLSEERAVRVKIELPGGDCKTMSKIGVDFVKLIDNFKGPNEKKSEIAFFKDTQVEVMMQNNFNNMKRVEAFVINQKGLQGIVEIMRPIQKDFNEDLKLGEKYSNSLIQKLNTSIKFKANVQHEQFKAIQELKVTVKKLPRRKPSGQHLLGKLSK